MSALQSTQVLLRVNLSDGLSNEDLKSLTEAAKKLGSLDRAVISALRAGLPQITKKGAKAR